MKPLYPHILQTPQWGEAKCFAQPGWGNFLFVKFKKEYTPRLCPVVENWAEVEWSVLILERNLGLKQRIHYIPRGPFVDWQEESTSEEVLAFVKDYAKERKVIFSRFEPNHYKEDFNYNLIKESGFKKTDDFVQAQDTVKVKIDLPDEELLASFHKKHRYNIRLAQRRGLTVRRSTNLEDISIFYDLTTKTDERSGGALNPHPKYYYQKIFEVLSRKGMAKLYIVEKDRAAISSSMVFSFGEESIYMFGASDYKYRRDMSNHLREWESMKDARDEGRKVFDLWGITMRNDPGEGIKRYKLGYSSNVKIMAGTFDYVVSPLKYHLFMLANRVRRG